MSIPLPLSTQDLNIPDEFKVTKKNEQFLLYDSGIEVSRLLIFGTLRNLSDLTSHGHWFMDGTFSSSPLIFAQLYTIHYFHNGRNVP